MKSRRSTPVKHSAARTGAPATKRLGTKRLGPGQRLGTKRLGHQRLLPARRSHQGALVAARHDQARVGDEPARGLSTLQRAPVVLGVDHPDARRHHHEVVEVGAPAGDGPVVQYDAAPADGIVEPASDALLALGAAAPGLRGPLRPSEEPYQRGEPTEDRLETSLVLGAPALVLRPGGTAGATTAARAAGPALVVHAGER